MKTQKIVPNLWFTTEDGSLSGILEYYREVFENEFFIGQIMPLGDTPSGYSEICDVQIFGQNFVFLSTSVEHHSLNDSVSMIINCIDQQEIDRYWNYFTAGGEESQCGWCIDQFGLRWQVLPDNLPERMSGPKAFEVMMRQRKIIIFEYLT